MGESRNEDILLSIINGTAYTAAPQSRIEDLLLQVKQVIEASGADTYTKAEIDNLLSAVVQEIDWKESVATFSDLATTYPDAEDGWTSSVLDTDDIYRYNGTAWVNIYRLPPLATSLSAGLMSSGDKDKLDTIERAANKTIVDASLSASSENPVQNKVINSALSGKVDKENGKGLSSNDFTTAEKTKLSGIESGAQVNTVTGIKGDNEIDYRAGNVNITKGDIGLGNVDNTADANKSVSYAASAGDADTLDSYHHSSFVKGNDIVTKSSVDYLHGVDLSDAKILSTNGLKNWNGRSSGDISNLQYCDRGRFGTIVTANTGSTVDISSTSMNGELISETTDLNTIPATITNHRLAWNELSGAMTNAPAGYNSASNKWGHLLTMVHSYSTNNSTQLLLGMTFSGIYYRNIGAGDDTWKEIIHSGNYSSVIPTATTSANGLMSNSQVTALNNSIKNNIETDDDFNDMYVTGIYAMQNANHCPSGDYASLLVMHSDNLNDDSYFHQIAAEEGTDNIFIRNKGNTNAAFSSWKQFFTTGNCPIDIDEGEEIGDKWVSKNYAKFANGLCVQWGSASDITSGYTFTFPYAFSDVPSVCVNRGIVDSITTGGFTMIADSAASDDTIYYTAIGYIS